MLYPIELQEPLLRGVSRVVRGDARMIHGVVPQDSVHDVWQPPLPKNYTRCGVKDNLAAGEVFARLCEKNTASRFGAN